MSVLAELERRLGVMFRDGGLLAAAVTHRSYAGEQGGDDNERLELLGDAVVGLVVVENLYRSRPQQREGELTQLKSRMVSGEALAALARTYDIGGALRLGQGEMQTGGADKDSVLASAMEAVIGAVYLDSGLAAAARVLGPLFEAPLPDADDKGVLQEWLQEQSRPLPYYRLTSTSGADHEPLFTVHCLVGGEVAGVGAGPTKKKAEQAAARAACEKLGIGS